MKAVLEKFRGPYCVITELNVIISHNSCRFEMSNPGNRRRAIDL